MGLKWRVKKERKYAKKAFFSLVYSSAAVSGSSALGAAVVNKPIWSRVGVGQSKKKGNVLPANVFQRRKEVVGKAFIKEI